MGCRLRRPILVLLLRCWRPLDVLDAALHGLIRPGPGGLLLSLLSSGEVEAEPEMDGDPASAPQHVQARTEPLEQAILRAMEVGTRSAGNRWTRDALAEYLTASGVPHTPEELAEAVARLADVDHLRRVQRQPYAVYPQFLVRRGLRRYDRTDALAADVCAVLRGHGERFSSDEQLQSWLTKDGVQWSPEELTEALDHPERTGRVKRDRAEQFRFNSPIGGLYIEPKIYDDR
jgi:hypothetical protein